MRLITQQDVQGWDGVFSSPKRTRKRGRRGVNTQRHSLPFPVVVEKRDEPTPRSKSFRFKPQQDMQGEIESTPPRGLSDALGPFGDSDVSSLRGDDRRHSAPSVTSNGVGSITSLLEPRSRWSNWRFSLSSNVSSSSSSSALTRFSGSTASTSLTAMSSGTLSNRSSRGSVLQKEKRFSSVRCELNVISSQVPVLNPG